VRAKQQLRQDEQAQALERTCTRAAAAEEELRRGKDVFLFDRQTHTGFCGHMVGKQDTSTLGQGLARGVDSCVQPEESAERASSMNAF